jgi:hypothetical protein
MDAMNRPRVRATSRRRGVFLGLVAAGLGLGLTPLSRPARAAPPAPAPAPTPISAPTSLFGVPLPPGLPPLPAGFPQVPYWSPDRVLVLPSLGEPINTQLLSQLLGAKAAGKAAGCGANEVAPGEYVKLDCRPYADVLSAVRDVFDPAKLDLLSKGQLHVTPQSAPPSQGAREGLPLEVDHRTMGLEGPVKDQGLVGNCSAFSLSSVVDNAILRMHRADVVSPEHLWARYGNGDMGSAGDSNLNKPVALNQTWPYSVKQACELVRDPNDECGQLLGVTPNSAPSDAALQLQYANAERAGVYRIASIDRITSRRGVNVDAIAAVLATGADVWAGFDVDVAAWKSTSQVNSVIRDWPTPNAGHAVALAGYRQAPGGGGRQFLVHNSWGGRWGDHGFAWVNEAMVRDHLQVAYKVTVVDPRTPRLGAQTDDECGAGSLVDGVTGQCGAACPDGKRRLAGQCLGR